MNNYFTMFHSTRALYSNLMILFAIESEILSCCLLKIHEPQSYKGRDNNEIMLVHSINPLRLGLQNALLDTVLRQNPCSKCIYLDADSIVISYSCSVYPNPPHAHRQLKRSKFDKSSLPRSAPFEAFD